MKIHTEGDKAPRIYLKSEKLDFGGVVIEPGWGIMPKEGVCARHFVRNLAQMMKLVEKEETKDNELKKWIKNTCPGSYLYRSDGETDLTNLIKGDVEFDLLDEDLDTTSSSHTSTTISTVVGMVSTQGKKGAAELDSFIGGLYFNHDYMAVKRRIRKILMRNTDGLHELYLKQKKTNESDLNANVRHPFFDFVEELNIRIMCFTPEFKRVLTRDYNARQVLKGDTTNFHQSWMQEMNIINDFLPRLLKDAEKAFLDKIGISFAKLQQFLRGYAHLRLLDVDYGKHTKVSSSLVKAFGTLVYPMDASPQLEQLLNYYLWNKLTTKQLEKVVQIVRDHLKTGYSANCNAAIAQVLNRSPQDIQWEYQWLKMNSRNFKVKMTTAEV